EFSSLFGSRLCLSPPSFRSMILSNLFLHIFLFRTNVADSMREIREELKNEKYALEMATNTLLGSLNDVKGWKTDIIAAIARSNQDRPSVGDREIDLSDLRHQFSQTTERLRVEQVSLKIIDQLCFREIDDRKEMVSQPHE